MMRDIKEFEARKLFRIKYNFSLIESIKILFWIQIILKTKEKMITLQRKLKYLFEQEKSKKELGYKL